MWDGGREPPSPFFEQPEIPPEQVYIWHAFHDLGTERQIGMGMGPIPFFAMRAYATDILGLAGDEVERFEDIIRKLDSEYLKLQSAKLSSKKAGKGEKKALEPEQTISVMDVSAQREMFKGLRERAAAQKRKRNEPQPNRIPANPGKG